MLRSLGLFALVAGAIALTWSGLGRPIPMPPSPLGSGGKLTCISYAPFHDDQAPFTWDLRIPDDQIRDDLARLSSLTSCVRTYSALGAQGRVTALAAERGLKVLQGIWLGRNPAENRREIEAALRIARNHPGTVDALIVGNETLLRGELSPARVGVYLAEAKRRSGLPVTYADVWEFWLKAKELAPVSDFITIHILPYWEDKPVRLKDAIAHVRDVRRRIEAAFPGKDILIGEIGWPSKGRMRDGALPSPANQALFLSGVVAAAKQDGWRVNLIEAFDQPWKRLLEGTVGGYWGMYDDEARTPKFLFGDPVSNHPNWRLNTGLGIGAALLVFVAFWLGEWQQKRERSWRRDLANAGIALGAGLLFGLAAANLPLEGEMASDRLRAVAMLVLALTAPMAAGYALGRGDRITGLATALNPSNRRRSELVEVVLAGLLGATLVAAIHVALGLVFDPRYKDFPFAALLGPVVAFAVLAFAGSKVSPRPGRAEIAAAILLSGSALFIVANEGIANWQAVALAGLLLLLALTSLRTAPG